MKAKKGTFKISLEKLKSSEVTLLEARTLHWAFLFGDGDLPISFFTRRLFNHSCKGDEKTDLLNNLVEKGLLEKKEALAIRNGRPPLFFAITSKGKELLNQICE